MNSGRHAYIFAKVKAELVRRPPGQPLAGHDVGPHGQNQREDDQREHPVTARRFDVGQVDAH